MTVEFPCQLVVNNTTLPSRELLLDRLSPADDRDHVRVVVRLKQRETLTGFVKYWYYDLPDDSEERERFEDEFKNVEEEPYSGFNYD